MRNARPNNCNESFEQWRQRMLDETARFIEWGLQNPDKVDHIPTHQINRGGFSERVKSLFWTLVMQNPDLPD